MRYSEIITESRSAPLYHYMDGEKAVNVFNADEMPARWQHDIPGMGKVRGNSFTRNTRYNHGRPVRIVANQERLAERNRIIPLASSLEHRLHSPSNRR